MENKSKYDEIMSLPHHVSATRPQMSMLDRAAQFSPFAALTGYDAAIKETGRLTDEKIVMDEEALNILNMKFQILARSGSMSGLEKFAGIYGEKVLADKPLFDEFYENDFENAKSICEFNPNAAMAVHTVKEMGLHVAPATNPIPPPPRKAASVGQDWSRRTLSCTPLMKTSASASRTPTITGKLQNGLASSRSNV